MLTAVQADLYLHHLEIQSNNPLGLAKFYSNVMSMEINKLNTSWSHFNLYNQAVVHTEKPSEVFSYILSATLYPLACKRAGSFATCA